MRITISAVPVISMPCLYLSDFRLDDIQTKILSVLLDYWCVCYFNVTWCELKVCVCRLDHPVDNWHAGASNDSLRRATTLITLSSRMQSRVNPDFNVVKSLIFLLQMFFVKMYWDQNWTKMWVRLLNWNDISYNMIIDVLIVLLRVVMEFCGESQLSHNTYTCRVWSCISVHHMYKVQG